MSLTNSSPFDVARAASVSSFALARLSVQARNDALTKIHTALSNAKEEILQANANDLIAATEAARNGQLSQSLVKRLDLGKKGKFEDMLQGILDVRSLEDPGEWRSLLLSETGTNHPLRLRHDSTDVAAAFSWQSRSAYGA